jgi:phenylpropionate dioxygenase-like ring-hydroxylating dioxygenase large terminal subunit
MASLKKYRTETVGDLVFVNLSEECCTLAEYLGPGYAMCCEWFSPAWRLTLATEQEIPGNWKLLIENVIENYHLTEVHGQTFKSLPPEEACHHELAELWTLYTEQGSGEHSHLRRLADVLYRILQIEPPPGIEVFHLFPHQVFVRMGLHSWVQAAIPEGPANARNVWRFFHYRGTKPKLSARVIARILKIWGKRFFTRVLAEDAAILPAVQKGLDAPASPVGGLISTREERIFQFQKYVSERTACPFCDQTSPAEPATCQHGN